MFVRVCVCVVFEVALGLAPPTQKKARSEAFGGHFFDSSFYFTGSFQRFPRQFAVEKLMEKCQQMGVGPRAVTVRVLVSKLLPGFGFGRFAFFFITFLPARFLANPHAASFSRPPSLLSPVRD